MLRSAISSLQAIPKPSRPPASERDFEKVCVTSRLLYLWIRLTALFMPKSTYASSITTTDSGFEETIFSMSLRLNAIPVGALGFAIKIVLFIPM